MSTDTARDRHTLLPLALIVVAPVAALLVSVHALAGATLADFRPFLNDEVYYWHQIATAAAAGTRGGYYTFDEAIPAVDTFRFGPHGPVYPLLIGTVARFAGWHRASAPIFNVVWITASIVAFWAMARPAPRRLWLLTTLVATFWPLSFWAASNMQESFHHGVAIVLAGTFVAIGRGSRGAAVTAWIVLLIAMIVRPSWGVLLPALCVLPMRRRTPARLLAASALSAIVLAAVIVTFTRIAAPLPGAFEFLKLAGLEDGAAPILSNAGANLTRLVTAGDDYDPLEIVHRVEYVAMTVLVAVVAIGSWRRDESPTERLQVAAQAFQLAAIVAAMILFYALTNWTEHRIISAHLLLAAMVLAVLPGWRGPWMAAALMLANLMALPIYAESFRQVRTDNFVWDRRPLRVFEETIDGRLRYEPDAPPWCNTILTSQYPPDLIAVPAGIGISGSRRPDEMQAPRSRYLLLDAAAYAALSGRVRLEQIGAPLPYGTIYLNLDARCPR